MTSKIPVVGEWYHDLEGNQVFEVVAVDEQFGTIEIQYLGGEISEIDFDAWPQIPLAPAEAPEDAGAGYELSREDEWDCDEPMVPESWSNPLVSIEPDSFPGFDDF